MCVCVCFNCSTFDSLFYVATEGFCLVLTYIIKSVYLFFEIENVMLRLGMVVDNLDGVAF